MVPRDVPQILFPLSKDMKGFMLFKKHRIFFKKKQCPVSEQTSLCTGCMELLDNTGELRGHIASVSYYFQGIKLTYHCFGSAV